MKKIHTKSDGEYNTIKRKLSDISKTINYSENLKSINNNDKLVSLVYTPYTLGRPCECMASSLWGKYKVLLNFLSCNILVFTYLISVNVQLHSTTICWR